MKALHSWLASPIDDITGRTKSLIFWYLVSCNSQFQLRCKLQLVSRTGNPHFGYRRSLKHIKSVIYRCCLGAFRQTKQKRWLKERFWSKILAEIFGGIFKNVDKWLKNWKRKKILEILIQFILSDSPDLIHFSRWWYHKRNQNQIAYK